ncbi:MAG: hypothetical protein EOP35_24970, partial [Rubrivivax sp.]
MLGAVAARADDSFAQHFEQAQYQALPLGTARAGAPPPPVGPGWQTVALPDIQRPSRPPAADPGSERAMHWYLLRWTMPAGLAADEPLVVYVPRAFSGPLQLWRLDAQRWRPVYDDQVWDLEQWNLPLLLSLPPKLLAPGETLTLALGVPAERGANFSLSSVWVGPEAELRDRHALRWALQRTVPAASSLAMLLLGVLSLFVWLGRRHERGYLYFALAAIGWTLRNLHLFMIHPEGGWALDWFCWLSVASIWWLMLPTYLFAFRFDARRMPHLERWLAGFVLAGTVITMPDLLP